MFRVSVEKLDEDYDEMTLPGHHRIFLEETSTILVQKLPVWVSQFDIYATSAAANITDEGLRALATLACVLETDFQSDPHPDLIYILEDEACLAGALDVRFQKVCEGVLPPHIIYCDVLTSEAQIYLLFPGFTLQFLPSEESTGLAAFDILFKLCVVNGVRLPTTLRKFYGFVEHFLFRTIVTSSHAPPDSVIKMHDCLQRTVSPWEGVEEVNSKYFITSGVRHIRLEENICILIPKIWLWARTSFCGKQTYSICTLVKDEGLKSLCILASYLESENSCSAGPHPHLLYVCKDEDHVHDHGVWARASQSGNGMLPPHIVYCSRDSLIFVVYCGEVIHFNIQENKPSTGCAAFILLFQLYVVNKIPFPDSLLQFYIFVERFVAEIMYTPNLEPSMRCAEIYEYVKNLSLKKIWREKIRL